MRRNRTIGGSLALAALIALSAGAGTGTANSGLGTTTVDISGTKLIVDAANVGNSITVTADSASTFRVSDTAAGINFGASLDCAPSGLHEVTCTDGSIDWIDVFAGGTDAMNDSVTVTANTDEVVKVYSGAGNDTLTVNRAEYYEIESGSGADTLDGNTSADAGFDPGPGNDTVLGGSGDDFILTSTGADNIFGGGGGGDVISYDALGGPVTVTLNGSGGDGKAGENDNVHTDVEDVVGTSSADSITGSTAGNFLLGYEGADTLSGGDGNDSLNGASGDDTINGGTGADSIEGWIDDDDLNGGSGADEISGYAGLDDITGGSGGDTVWGNTGNDILRMEDGQADIGYCHEGTDVLYADSLDLTDPFYFSDCETIH